ncbi:MAG: hypothetical protein Q9208_006320 [Pyrenodesmia sp. 3 TL-2023]
MGKRDWAAAFAAGSAPTVIAPNFFNVAPEQAARKVAKEAAKAVKAKAEKAKAKAKEAEKGEEEGKDVEAPKLNSKAKRAVRMQSALALLAEAIPDILDENFPEDITDEDKAWRREERRKMLSLLAGKEEDKDKWIVQGRVDKLTAANKERMDVQKEGEQENTAQG